MPAGNVGAFKAHGSRGNLLRIKDIGITLGDIKMINDKNLRRGMDLCGGFNLPIAVILSLDKKPMGIKGLMGEEQNQGKQKGFHCNLIKGEGIL